MSINSIAKENSCLILLLLRRSCDSRKYTYFFPTYLLVPPKPGSGLHRVWVEHAAKSPDALAKLPISYDFWEGKESSDQEEDMARKRSWRVGAAQMENFRTLASKYEGTHNFHNFTVGRDFKDRSNNRFMKKIEVPCPSSKDIYVQCLCRLTIGC